MQITLRINDKVIQTTGSLMDWRMANNGLTLSIADNHSTDTIRVVLNEREVELLRREIEQYQAKS